MAASLVAGTVKALTSTGNLLAGICELSRRLLQLAPLTQLLEPRAAHYLLCVERQVQCLIAPLQLCMLLAQRRSSILDPTIELVRQTLCRVELRVAAVSALLGRSYVGTPKIRRNGVVGTALRSSPEKKRHTLVMVLRWCVDELNIAATQLTLAISTYHLHSTGRMPILSTDIPTPPSARQEGNVLQPRGANSPVQPFAARRSSRQDVWHPLIPTAELSASPRLGSTISAATLLRAFTRLIAAEGQTGDLSYTRGRLLVLAPASNENQLPRWIPVFKRCAFRVCRGICVDALSGTVAKAAAPTLAFESLELRPPARRTAATCAPRTTDSESPRACGTRVGRLGVAAGHDDSSVPSTTKCDEGEDATSATLECENDDDSSSNSSSCEMERDEECDFVIVARPDIDQFGRRIPVIGETIAAAAASAKCTRPMSDGCVLRQPNGDSRTTGGSGRAKKRAMETGRGAGGGRRLRSVPRSFSDVLAAVPRALSWPICFALRMRLAPAMCPNVKRRGKPTHEQGLLQPEASRKVASGTQGRYEWHRRTCEWTGCAHPTLFWTVERYHLADGSIDSFGGHLGATARNSRPQAAVCWDNAQTCAWLSNLFQSETRATSRRKAIVAGPTVSRHQRASRILARIDRSYCSGGVSQGAASNRRRARISILFPRRWPSRTRVSQMMPSSSSSSSAVSVVASSEGGSGLTLAGLRGRLSFAFVFELESRDGSGHSTRSWSGASSGPFNNDDTTETAGSLYPDPTTSPNPRFDPVIRPQPNFTATSAALLTTVDSPKSQIDARRRGPGSLHTSDWSSDSECDVEFGGALRLLNQTLGDSSAASNRSMASSWHSAQPWNTAPSPKPPPPNNRRRHKEACCRPGFFSSEVRLSPLQLLYMARLCYLEWLLARSPSGPLRLGSNIINEVIHVAATSASQPNLDTSRRGRVASRLPPDFTTSIATTYSASENPEYHEDCGGKCSNRRCHTGNNLQASSRWNWFHYFDVTSIWNSITDEHLEALLANCLIEGYQTVPIWDKF